MKQIRPDCAQCIRYDPKAAARDPDYVCTANMRPYPAVCWDSHATKQEKEQEEET